MTCIKIFYICRKNTLKEKRAFVNYVYFNCNILYGVLKSCNAVFFVLKSYFNRQALVLPFVALEGRIAATLSKKIAAPHTANYEKEIQRIWTILFCFVWNFTGMCHVP